MKTTTIALLAALTIAGGGIASAQTVSPAVPAPAVTPMPITTPMPIATIAPAVTPAPMITPVSIPSSLPQTGPLAPGR